MQKHIKEVINLLISALAEKFDDFHGIYLHGSYVDGSNQKDDDIELVAIFDSEDKHKRELIWPIVGKIETDLDVYIDLHPLTMEALKQDEEFYDNIVNKGIYFKAEENKLELNQ